MKIDLLDLKENKERYMGSFGWKNTRGKFIQVYYNIKNKRNRFL